MTGSFRKCYLELLNRMGHKDSPHYCIIRVSTDEDYRLILQDELTNYNQKFCDQTMRPVLVPAVSELKVILKGVNRQMFGSEI